MPVRQARARSARAAARRAPCAASMGWQALPVRNPRPIVPKTWPPRRIAVRRAHARTSRTPSRLCRRRQTRRQGPLRSPRSCACRSGTMPRPIRPLSGRKLLSAGRTIVELRSARRLRRRRHRATPLSRGLDPKPRLLRGRRITERAASLTRRAPRLRQRLRTPLALPVRHGRTGERRAPPSARLAQPRGRRSGLVLPTRARARRRFVAGCWRPVSKLARSVARPARSRARGWPATAA